MKRSIQFLITLFIFTLSPGLMEEAWAQDPSCVDGVDNDEDGITDEQDECAEGECPPVCNGVWDARDKGVVDCDAGDGCYEQSHAKACQCKGGSSKSLGNGHCCPSGFKAKGGLCVEKKSSTKSQVAEVNITPAAFCGNGKREVGEECDDSDDDSGDGCSSSCEEERGWSCSEDDKDFSTCLTTCGDNIKAGLEGCDEGANNGEMDGSCSDTCETRKCGDSKVDTWAGEVCDAGKLNGNLKSDCLDNCLPRKCGDGFIEGPETCDLGEGNGEEGKGCSSICQVVAGFTCEGQPSICSKPEDIAKEQSTAETIEEETTDVTMASTAGARVMVSTLSGEDTPPVIVQGVFGLQVYLMEPVGLSFELALGVWPYDDAAPFAGSGRAAFLLYGENWEVDIGLTASYLDSLTSGQLGQLVVWAGPQGRFGWENFRFQVEIGWPVFHENNHPDGGDAVGGWWLGGGLMGRWNWYDEEDYDDSSSASSFQFNLY